jgi:hypothetical protein
MSAKRRAKVPRPRAAAHARDYCYFDMPTLQWGRTLVTALTVARSWAEPRGFKDTDDIAAYKTPTGWYTVRAPRDEVTQIAWAAFVQCYIRASDGGAYGQLHNAIPVGSRRVFPLRHRG